ncbi:methyltransferase domain-containing protein [Aequorivita sp. SDUM287046]|uniref:Methyltransferase domain-containing protein n=1 Tax=Aequorivita aurantiaca TaxID=3053356 RepID=A0ABT8DF67_9FLAO|nr:methyltransferase domain-containing protein [Aequorivita aurantiaca]MDN3723493.1 methyltransferase domain-containing protein [Aequorivita aurantiaca]
MIKFSNKYRSDQIEIMDDMDFHGEEMKNLLADLFTVNKWLGGNTITIDGLIKIIKDHSNKGPIILLDIGCGDGALLRRCTEFGRRHNLTFECIGLDFNQNIINIAKNQSEKYPNIRFEKVDVFLNKELIPNCDIAICSLFLHHLENNKIEDLLKVLIRKSDMGLIINDLHRSRYAFELFKIFGQLFLKTKTARHDGLVSIARGFKKSELMQLSYKIPNQKSEINWRWAFRYQWILKKNI